MYTKSWLTNEAGDEKEIVSFGPVCVHPDFQRQGVGKKLIQLTKTLAKEMGYDAICILGHPSNYVTHGFRSCRDFNMTMDGERYPYGLLVLELQAGALKDHSWILRQSDIYNVDQDKVAEFDKQFPEKEKKYQPSQTLFEMACQAFILDAE